VPGGPRLEVRAKNPAIVMAGLTLFFEEFWLVGGSKDIFDFQLTIDDFRLRKNCVNPGICLFTPCEFTAPLLQKARVVQKYPSFYGT